jgi:siroheme synthase
VVVSTVEAMQRDAAANQVKAPTLMIIGHVARSAAELQWFGQSAISGSASA